MKLNYKILGEGEPMVIMHGLYGSSDNWVGIARELQAYFKIVLVDLRNHGKSPHADDHNYNVMADDLMVLLNDLQIYSTILIGHSMGGKVALAFTAFNPERVRRLVVVDISYRTYTIDEGDMQFNEHRNILKSLSEIKLSEMNSREQVDEILSNNIPSSRVRAFLLKNLYRTREKQFKWKLNLPVLQLNIEKVLEGFESYKSEFQELNQPVLFIKGGASEYIQQKDVVSLPKYFRNAKVVTIPEASHWVHAEKPLEFLQVVKEFCI